MGNIKPTFIKRGAEKLMQDHESELTTDFDKNQDVVRKYIQANKFIKNKIAGYLTRKVRNKGRKRPVMKAIEKKPSRTGRSGRQGRSGQRRR